MNERLHTLVWRLRSLVGDHRSRFGGRAGPPPSDGPTNAAEPDDGASARRDRPSDPVLTPRERVLEVLRRHGGSMKQQALGDQLGWSDATVSRRLCDLEGTEVVVRHQIGREKLVSIPGEEPDCLASCHPADATGT